MLSLDERDTIEQMFRDTGGKAVTVGNEETWGHFVIEAQVDLGDLGVVDDVPTLTVPRMVPGFVQDAEVEVEGEGTYLVSMRSPAGAPDELLLVLREA